MTAGAWVASLVGVVKSLSAVSWLKVVIWLKSHLIRRHQDLNMLIFV